MAIGEIGGGLRLALGVREASSALGISPRKLWELSAPRGPIPCSRIGARVLYRVADLDGFLVEQQQPGGTAR